MDDFLSIENEYLLVSRAAIYAGFQNISPSKNVSWLFYIFVTQALFKKVQALMPKKYVNRRVVGPLLITIT